MWKKVVTLACVVYPRRESADEEAQCCEWVDSSCAGSIRGPRLQSDSELVCVDSASLCIG